MKKCKVLISMLVVHKKMKILIISSILLQLSLANANEISIPDSLLQKWYTNNSHNLDQQAITNGIAPGYIASINVYSNENWLRDSYYGSEGGMYQRDDPSFYRSEINFYLNKMDRNGTLSNLYNASTGGIIDHVEDGHNFDIQNMLIHLAYSYWIKTNDTSYIQSQWNNLDKVITRIHENAGQNNLVNSPTLEVDWGDSICNTDTTVNNKNGYESADFIIAAKQMKIMSDAIGDTINSTKYQQWADNTTFAMNNLMWLPSNGYYKGYLLDLNGWNNTSTFLLTNIYALEAGIANSTQVDSIYHALNSMKNNSNPAGGIDVVYPFNYNGCTRHGPGTYQNGGTWPWKDSETALFLYNAGYSDLAYQMFTGVKYDVIQGKNGAEWRTGYSGNSIAYGGTSMVANNFMRRSIVEGLFGIIPLESGYKKVAINPRIPTNWTFASLNMSTLNNTNINISINHSIYGKYILTITGNKNVSASFKVRIPTNWSGTIVTNSRCNIIPSSIVNNGTDTYTTFNVKRLNNVYEINRIENFLEELTRCFKMK